MAKKQIDIGGKTRLKPISLRILFTSINLIIGILGIQLLLNTMIIFDWIVSLLALTFAVVGGIEIGLKRFTKLSELKKFGALQWIGSFVVITLFVFSILNFFNIVELFVLNQVIGTIFIGSALVTTFDMWI